MFWVLILIFFSADGQQVQAFIEPTQQACVEDAGKRVTDISASRPPELMGIGVRCLGPITDPAHPLQKD